MLELLLRAKQEADERSANSDPNWGLANPSDIEESSLRELAPNLKRFVGDVVARIPNLRVTCCAGSLFFFDNLSEGPCVISIHEDQVHEGHLMRWMGNVFYRRERGEFKHSYFDLNFPESWLAFREACKLVIDDREISNRV